jgi:hypothetical protein
MINKPAILLIIFNRVNKTKQIISALSEIKPSKIYVFADGPRDIKEDLICNETRSIINKINWECEIITNFNKINLGCKIAVSNSLDWFFTYETEGIILEDDCIPSIDFYNFCSSMLSKYRDDESVGSITGTKISPFNTNYNIDYFASKYPNVWGWATWKRVWDKYDVYIKNWNTEWESNKLDEYLNNEKCSNYWKVIFTKIYEEKIDTWDYQLIFLFFKERYLCITPNSNLIKNIGFDNEATHTFSENSWVSKRNIQNFNIKNNEYKGNIKLFNNHYDSNLESYIYGISNPNIFKRLIRLLFY